MQTKYTIADLDVIIRAYATAALWSSTDDNCESLDAVYSSDDLGKSTIAEFNLDCTEFAQSNIELLHESGLSLEQIGHNFWLTRNGHGTGFWDRGLGAIGKELTKAADAYGVVDLYVGDDGLIYS